MFRFHTISKRVIQSVVLVGAPGISFGFYSVGFKEDVTTYNVMHLMVQKALPIGGYVAAGVYHGPQHR